MFSIWGIELPKKLLLLLCIEVMAAFSCILLALQGPVGQQLHQLFLYIQQQGLQHVTALSSFMPI